jgi:hypothetical protein
MLRRTLVCTVQGLFAVLLLISFGVAGEPDPAAATPNIWGVWLGTVGDPNVPAPYRNTPWPALEFTAWGAAESKRLTTFETPDECKPYGPMGHMSASSLFPLEFARTTKGIVIMYEPSPLPRRIFMDGRAHPEDLDATWLGHSVGHWEGETLVVDTVGTNGRGRPLNGYLAGAVYSKTDMAPRLPVSDQLHMVERLRLVAGGQYLEDEITVTDLKTYTQPFTVRHYWQRRSDLDVLEYFCDDDNRGYETEGHSRNAR